MQKEGENYIKFQRKQLERFWQEKELIQGNQEIIENVEGFKYPLKIA